MKRRQVLAALLATISVGYRRTAQAKDVALFSAAPEKIRLIPDAWHIRNVGRLSGGRLFFVDSQVHYSSGVTRDFVCTFFFDPGGWLVDHSIELIGARGL